MKGDEAELGDPIEDATSLAAVSDLIEVKEKIFVTAGLGADRRTGIQDASALRAIAEINRAGGFLGSLSIEQTSAGYKFYSNSAKYILAHQNHHPGSVRQIMAAVEGFYGNEKNPYLPDRRGEGLTTYIWPLMAMLWFFDVRIMAKRSFMVKWLKDEKDRAKAFDIFWKKRSEIEIRDYEEFPKMGEDI